jgi:hypothetical protein
MEDKKIIAIIRASKKRDLPHKSWNYALFRQGCFGNRAHAWDNIKELQESGWSKDVCIRDRRGTNRADDKAPLPLHNIPKEDLQQTIQALTSKGIPIKAMTFNQSMPDHHLTIQGEVTRALDGTLHLTYTNAQKPMRAGLLKKTELAKGLKAKIILQHFLWPSSLKEIEDCLEYFSTGTQTPSPTVEFSTYSIPVGDTPGHNTVIWEVRNY